MKAELFDREIQLLQDQLHGLNIGVLVQFYKWQMNEIETLKGRCTYLEKRVEALELRHDC